MTSPVLLTIALISTTRIYNVLSLDGCSGRSYSFTWNSALGRYTYTPANAAEANDLIENAGGTAYHAFSLVLEPAPTPPAPAPESTPIPQQITLPFSLPEDAAKLERSQLVGLLNGVGLYAGPKETTDKLARIVHGLFVGYAMAATGEQLVIPEPKPAPPAETVPDGNGGSTSATSEHTPQQEGR